MCRKPAAGCGPRHTVCPEVEMRYYIIHMYIYMCVCAIYIYTYDMYIAFKQYLN
jgi:hypothetical protein